MRGSKGLKALLVTWELLALLLLRIYGHVRNSFPLLLFFRDYNYIFAGTLSSSKDHLHLPFAHSTF